MIESIEAKIDADSPFFEVIENAYRVFKTPAPAITGVCENCCMDSAIEADFLQHPIRELPYSYLVDWFFGACDPPLPKSVWMWLLPRILEVLASGEEVSYVGDEIALNRFPTGDNQQWNREQWQVLDQFQKLYLLKVTENEWGPTFDSLCMFDLAGWDILSLLDQVWGLSDELLIEAIWFHDCSSSEDCQYLSAFWCDQSKPKVEAFLTSPKLLVRLNAAVEGKKLSTVYSKQAIEYAVFLEKFMNRHY